MDARELEKIIQADVGPTVKQSGSHRHCKHPPIPKKVTIPFHGHGYLNIKTVNTILKQTGAEISPS